MAAAHDSVGAFAVAAGTTAITPAIPNTTAGVFAILFASTRTSATLIVNLDDGTWTTLVSQAQASLSYQIRYRRLTGGDASPSVSGGGNGTYGFVACATGILSTGSPLDVAASQNNAASGTTGTATGVTLATSGALVYSIFFGNNDTDAAGGWSNALRSGGTPAEIAEGNGYESATGSDASMGACAEVIAATGATGDVTMDVALSMTYSAVMVALTPEPAAGGLIAVPTILLNYRNMGLMQ